MWHSTDMGMVESIHLCLFHWVLNDVHARINRAGRYAAGLVPGARITPCFWASKSVARSCSWPSATAGPRSWSSWFGPTSYQRTEPPGILQQITQLGCSLVEPHEIQRIGIGFGGPVDVSQGRVIKSHQIRGWDNFHLSDWCRETFQLPMTLANDCDSAALGRSSIRGRAGASAVCST